MTTNVSNWGTALNEIANGEFQAARDSVEVRRRTGLKILWDLLPVESQPGVDKLRWDTDISAEGGTYFDRTTGVPGADSQQDNIRAELAWAGVDAGVTIGYDLLKLDPKYLSDGQRDAVGEAVAKAVSDVLLKIEKGLMLTGADSPTQEIRGLPAGIQAATTYAGINASTTAKWASYIDAASGDLTSAKMEAFLEGMAARNGKPVIAITGLRRYNRFVNDVQATQDIPGGMMVQMGGVSMTGFRFSDTIVMPVAGAPNTALYAFDPNDVAIVFNGLETVELPQESYNRRFKVRADVQLKVKNPYFAGAMTALQDA
jgi:hypothetical protein